MADARPAPPALQGRPVHRVWRSILGAFIGAFIGFITYWGGAALVAYDDLMHAAPSSLPWELLRPGQSVTAWEVVLALSGAAFGAAVASYRWNLAGRLSYVGLISL